MEYKITKDTGNFKKGQIINVRRGVKLPADLKKNVEKIGEKKSEKKDK